MKCVIILLLLTFLPKLLPAANESLVTLIDEAENSYEKYKEYRDEIHLHNTAETLKKALTLGENGALYYNLGIVHEEAKDYPYALLYYKRGLKYLPHFDPLHQRKIHLQEKMNIPVDSSPPFYYLFFPSTFTWRDFSNLLEGSWMVLWGLSLVLYIKGYSRYRRFRIFFALGIVTIASFGMLFAHTYTRTMQPRGLIIEEAVMYELPGSHHSSIMTLREGTEITIQEKRGQWKKAATEEKKGWILKNCFELI